MIDLDKKREMWRRASRKHRSRPEVRERQRLAAKVHEARYKERRRELNVAYNLHHKDKKRLAERNWVINNPEKVRAKQARRRAHRMGADGSHSALEWAVLCELSNGRCAYCQLPKKLTRDHFVPLSRGGSHYITNIVPTCRSCNSKKKNKTPEETAHWLAAQSIERIIQSQGDHQ